MNGFVVFYGGDASGKHGLWTTDGTALGTREIVPGTQGTQDLGPYNFISMGSYALFAGKDASGKVGLWRTDGQGGGAHTFELLPGTQGTVSLSPSGVTKLGSKALFQGWDSSAGIGVWISDGTAAGTMEIVSGQQSQDPKILINLSPGDFVVNRDRVAFAGYDFTGTRGLWLTDGTKSGTREIAPGQQGQFSLQPGPITAFGKGWVFSGLDSSGKAGMWATDGTTSGTIEILSGSQNLYQVSKIVTRAELPKSVAF